MILKFELLIEVTSVLWQNLFYPKLNLSELNIQWTFFLLPDQIRALFSTLFSLLEVLYTGICI